MCNELEITQSPFFSLFLFSVSSPPSSPLLTPAPHHIRIHLFWWIPVSNGTLPCSGFLQDQYQKQAHSVSQWPCGQGGGASNGLLCSHTFETSPAPASSPAWTFSPLLTPQSKRAHPYHHESRLKNEEFLHCRQQSSSSPPASYKHMSHRWFLLCCRHTEVEPVWKIFHICFILKLYWGVINSLNISQTLVTVVWFCPLTSSFIFGAPSVERMQCKDCF